MKAKTYRIIRYESAGSLGPDEGRIVGKVRSLSEARAVVRERLGLRALRPERRWDGHTDPGSVWQAVEAYHDLLEGEPHSEGCGGYQIELEKGEK